MKRLLEAVGKILVIRRSFAARLILLVVTFVSVPILVYDQFQQADEAKTMLLQRSLERQGSLIAEALRPSLESFQSADPQQRHALVSRLGDDRTNVKLLYRPVSAGDAEEFFYVDSSPASTTAYLEQERRRLIETGVFDELAQTCDRSRQLSTGFKNPAGVMEILTSLTPVHLPNGCWVVITSSSAEGLLGTTMGQPLWRTENMQMAVWIYLLAVAVIVWLFFDLWRNVKGFRRAARKIRLGERDRDSFLKLNQIPELSGVAEDFDALVEALTASERSIRRTAEENAHALKAPLAVIAQSVEPIKRSLPATSGPAHRSIELIEQAVTRLDGLVSVAREIAQAEADIIYPAKRRLDLSRLLYRLLASYGKILVAGGKRLETTITPNVDVLADEDLLEPIIENMLENAASFAPPGSAIEVRLERKPHQIELTIADRGSGVSPPDIDRIFERYYSRRPALAAGRQVSELTSTDDHFGLGLWIVRRNAEGLGGVVWARNRAGGGLAITVGLPVP